MSKTLKQLLINDELKAIVCKDNITDLECDLDSYPIDAWWPSRVWMNEGCKPPRPDVVVFPADAAIGAAVSVEMRSQSPFRVSAINAPESVMALCSDGTRFLLSHELVGTLQQPVARPPDLGVITLTLSTENGTSQTLSVKVHYARSFPEARRND